MAEYTFYKTQQLTQCINKTVQRDYQNRKIENTGELITKKAVHCSGRKTKLNTLIDRTSPNMFTS